VCSKQYDEPTGQYRETLHIDAINPNIIGNLPLRRGVFATNDYEFEFSNGLLTRYKSVRPNELVAALSAVPAVAKALVSIPAEIISLKVDYSSQEKAYYEAQQAVLKARLQLEDAQEKADAGTLLDDDSDSTTE